MASTPGQAALHTRLAHGKHTAQVHSLRTAHLAGPQRSFWRGGILAYVEVACNICHSQSATATFQFSLAWSWCLVMPRRLETYVDLCYVLKGFGNRLGGPLVGRDIGLCRSCLRECPFPSCPSLSLQFPISTFEAFRFPSVLVSEVDALVSEYDATVSDSGVYG